MPPKRRSPNTTDESATFRSSDFGGRRFGSGAPASNPRAQPDDRRASRPPALRDTLIPLSLALLGFLPAAGAAIPPAETLLPDDTLAMVTVPDAAQARALYRRTPESQLWNDPAMRAFSERFTEKMREQLIAPLERELNVRWADCAALPQGQLTCAVVPDGPPEAAGGATALLLLLDARDRREQLTQVLADLKQKWVDAGRTLRTEKIRDRDFTVLLAAANDVPKSVRDVLAPPRTFSDPNGGNKPPVPVELSPAQAQAAAVKRSYYFGQVDSLLVIATAQRPVERLLARLAGAPIPALADAPAFAANRDAVFRDAPLFGWINPRPFLALLARQFGDRPNPPELTNGAPENVFFLTFGAAKILSALGVSSLQSVAFSLRESDDGAFLQVFARAPESERRGLFKLLAGQSTESGPPPFVPADATSCWRWRVSGPQAWTLLEQTLKEVSPQVAGTFNWLLDSAAEVAQQRDPDFNLRRALLASLGDDVLGYREALPAGATDPDAASGLYLLSSPQPYQLVRALRTLFLLLPQPEGDPEREFLGRKIYSVLLPVLPGAEPPKGGLRVLYFAAAAGGVALSTDGPLLEEYLRGVDTRAKPLRAAPGFAEAAERVVGSGARWLSYENRGGMMAAAFAGLQKDTNYTSAFSALLPLPGGLEMVREAVDARAWMDLSLLPPYERVAKYFHFTVGALSASTDGITIKYFAPTPPELRRPPR